MSYFKTVDVNRNELGYDAWGKNKIAKDYSLFSSSFTHYISDYKWIELYNNIEQPKTNFTSVNGELVCNSNGGEALLSTKRHWQYQANRGLLYSNSAFIDNATLTNGKLYAAKVSRGVEYLEEITNLPPNYDPTKGNIYDIQIQWRGVGDMKFFINSELVYTFEFLGTLDNLSVSNPALGVSQYVDSNGNIKFGAFNHHNGVYFKWVFNTPQETQLRIGCVDLTSEAGQLETRSYASVTTSSQSGSIDISDYNYPIIAIRVPETINGVANTIDSVLNRISGYSDQRSILHVWTSRGGTGITGGTWTAIEQGAIEVSEDLTIDTTQMKLVYGIRIYIDVTETIGVADPQTEFYLTNGDYIVVTIHRETGGSAHAGATIEIGVAE